MAICQRNAEQNSTNYKERIKKINKTKENEEEISKHHLSNA